MPKAFTWPRIKLPPEFGGIMGVVGEGSKNSISETSTVNAPAASSSNSISETSTVTVV